MSPRPAMRVISFNANGLRAAARKGFFDWMKRQRADVVCIQELKAQEHQLGERQFHPRNHHVFFHCAERPGYSGVAIYSRHEPDRVQIGLDWPEFDREGRYIQADFGDLSIASLYFPSGSSGDHRQSIKFTCMDRLMEILLQKQRDGRRYIIAGDWNTAHKIIDIKNWRSNQKNSGFLPEERAWMDRLFGDAGFVDAQRVVNPKPEQYTWWSNRGRARENNVGWRIDYQVISPSLRDRVRKDSVYKRRWFSDHAPLMIDYEGELGHDF